MTEINVETQSHPSLLLYLRPLIHAYLNDQVTRTEFLERSEHLTRTWPNVQIRTERTR